MKKKFLPSFFAELAGTVKDIGGLFTFDFYLHRGRYPRHFRQQFKKGLHNLKQQEYLTTNGAAFKFTKKGKEWYQRNISKYTPFREKEWDGKWRVVFFDIPEELHTRRDIFRYRLKNLGFQQLQKSLLAMPFTCEKDVAEICSRLKINQYVDIIIAESIGAREEEFRKIYDI